MGPPTRMETVLTPLFGLGFGAATTEAPSIEITEPSRPLSDFIVDLLGLDPEGGVATFLHAVLEPAVQILLILVIAWVGLRLVRRLGRNLVERAKRPISADVFGAEISFGDAGAVSTRRRQRADAIGAVLSSILGAVVWTVAILTILGTTFGISLGPFLAGAGILGIALGFGAQDLVKDFISGLFMLVEDQYGVGDVIDVGDATGVVERVSLRTTRIRDVTGTLWHVPNGEIRRVGNMSQEWSRALLDTRVPYQTDVDRASEIIQRVADEMAVEDAYRRIFLADPEIWGVESLSADSVMIRLVVKTKPGEQWAIARELRRRIKIALDEVPESQGGTQVDVPLSGTAWLAEEEPTPPTPQPSAATGKGAAEEGAVETSDGQTTAPRPVPSSTDDPESET